MGIQAPRLYRKQTGVFFVRVLIDPVHFGPTPSTAKRLNKRELKRSLRTKNPKVARSISSYLNALVESVPTEQREDVVNHFFAHTINAWTLPGGVSCDDDDDQRRLVSFLQTFPRIEKALADSIVATGTPQAAGAAPPPPATTLTSLAPVPAASPGPTSDAEVEALVERALQRRLGRAQGDNLACELTPVEATSHTIAGPAPSTAPQIVVPYPHAARDDGAPHHQGKQQLPRRLWPKNPKRFSAAREAYLAYYNSTVSSQSDRTSADKERLLELFVEFLNAQHAYLGEDPWVHDLDSSHVSEFLSRHAKRPGKRKDADGKVLPVAPLTKLKVLNDLRHFFDYQYRPGKSTTERVSDGFEDAAKAWSLQAEREDVHYWPFTDGHIQQIFDPCQLLAHNRDPDYFWCPCLGLYLGVRLGEVVDAKLSDIGYMAAIDTWYIEIPVEGAKNGNSVRRLPITQPLIDLGFLDYVEHVRKLGATYLFPNRDWDASTYR